ncbi:MAG: aminoacyl-tRNA hydrolase [Spirochaetales bacterium]|nr:aminoacyl-tRNA hydrolase [Spirochaetales bacterium]
MGLGNPGSTYQNTRHNAGFWFVDQLAVLAGVSLYKPLFCSWRQAIVKYQSHTVVLIQPLTFMNQSGRILPRLQRRFGFEREHFLVAVDQMDLPPGRLRLKPKGSDAGHNGLKSLREAWGTDFFRRLTIGIGRPYDGAKVLEHVLGCLDTQGRQIVDHALQEAGVVFWSLLADQKPGCTEVQFWEHYQNELNRFRSSLPGSGSVSPSP